MRTSRTDMRRLLKFDDPALKFNGATAIQRAIVEFIGGLRGPRKHPVTCRQIVAWFRATTPEFTRIQLTVLVAQGRISCKAGAGKGSRRRSCVYEPAAT